MSVSVLSKIQTLAYGIGLLPPSPRAFLAFPKYVLEYREFKRLLEDDQGDWPLSRLPMLPDRFEGSGSLPRHYFLQDLLVANRVFTNAPQRHIDVGSRLDGFVAHVASFREIEVLDIRPQELQVKNVAFRQVDLTALDVSYHGCCDSVSCLHTLEHLGLGRYGDPIDPRGHEKGLEALASMLVKGGLLYLSVPMGRQRIEFNNQRVFSLATALDLVSRYFDVVRFSYIDDSEVLHEDAATHGDAAKGSYGCEYGLALFELTKK